MRIPERDVYRLICLLTYAYPWILTEPEAVPLGIKLTIYRETSYVRLLALYIIITVQPEYKFSGSTRFREFQKFGKI